MAQAADAQLEALAQYGLAGADSEFLQGAVDRHGILLGKLIHQAGSGNILYGIDDPTISADISTHAALGSVHHAKYTDAEAIVAVEGHGDAYNGSFLEPITFVVASNGTTITGTLDKNPSGSLTERFSDGFSTVASGQTVTLTAGGATTPKKNFIYILQSNKGVLVASDSDWPATEHIKVAEVVVQTAALVQSAGILANRNWNDFAKGTDDQGHHLHAWERLRWEHSAYKSGSAVTWTGSGGATLDLAITAGKAYQMHLQSVAAFDTTDPDKVYVVNHPTAYTATADIETLTVDSDNDPLANKYYNLVIWQSVSSGSEEEKVLINLPSGSYTKQGDAENDVSGYDNYSIPSGFRGYGYLVQRVTIKHSSGGGGTWTIVKENDLRGSVPTVAVGSGTASITTEFADSQFRLFDQGDPTALLAFQLSGISASTTRTITVPDTDLTLLAAEGTVVGASSQAQDFGSNGLKLDKLEESTGSAGITAVDTLYIDENAGFDKLVATHYSNTSVLAANISMRKARAGGAAVTSGDLLGWFNYRGAYNATPDWATGAGIVGAVTENWEANKYGTEIRFYTTATGGSVLTQRWTIGQDGSFTANGAMALTTTGLITATGGITVGALVQSDTDDTDDLGATGKRWKDIYFSGDLKDDTTSLSVADLKGPTRTIVLTAAGGAPTETSGCSGPTKAETGATAKSYFYLAFAANEKAFWQGVMPDNWDGDTTVMTATFHWLGASGHSASDTVIWGIKAVDIGNDEVLTGAFGTQRAVTDTVVTAGRLHISDATSSSFWPASPDPGETVIIEVERTGGTMSEEAHLLAVHIQYTTSAYSD